MLKNRSIALAVVVAALGYFVDVYDLLLFSIVRVASLKSLGVPEDEILGNGIFLINMQMCGLIVGGIFWGILGDKRGRLSVLFGSIILYSIANILNGFVHSIETYAVLRLIAGVGLAGELGAGVTLVSEIMPKESRGYATTIIASVGLAGAVVASVIGDSFDWRTAYIIGGVMGLLLLALRVAVSESGMFNALAGKEVRRGDLLLLVRSPKRIWRYLNCIMLGMPVCFSVYLLITFSPEIGKALGMLFPPIAGEAIMYTYIGLVLGDLASGLLSQKLRSRKKALYVFLILMSLALYLILSSDQISQFDFYMFSMFLGFSSGYWAVLVTTAAEQFGTNLRATVATTVPNLIRGAAIPMTLGFRWLEISMGKINSAMVIGSISILLAGLGLANLKESFGKELDFIEE